MVRHQMKLYNERRTQDALYLWQLLFDLVVMKTFKFKQQALTWKLFFSVAKVIFTAVANAGGNVGPFDSDTTLKFETVVTDTGDCYDPTSGKYITLTIFYGSGSDKVYDSWKIISIVLVT